MSTVSTNSEQPSVQAQAQEFAQCGLQNVQQFVQIPQVEHQLFIQPMLYKQYRQKVSYMQVPVAQTYTKVNMPQQDTGCGAQAQQNISTAPGGAVYGCGAAPYTTDSWGDVNPPDLLQTNNQWKSFAPANRMMYGGRPNSYASRY